MSLYTEMSKESENIKLSVVETAKKYSYDPDETVYGDRQIVSYGKDNNLPQLYRNCYLESATLKSIIDGAVCYILGEEVVVNDSGANWQKEVNHKGMTMRQFIANIALSYMIYGGFAYQVIYSKLNTIAEVYPLDFRKCRTNESGTKVFYSKKGWTKYGNKCEEFDRFDRDKINPEKRTQIVYVKGDYSTSVYPTPIWKGALNDVLTEIECGKYSLNSVSNGFSAKYVLNLPDAGNLTEEQKKILEKRIEEKFCGTETDSNFMIYYYGDKESQMNIAKIEADDAPDKFVAIKDNARSNIYTALRTTPNLMGLPTATTGFNSQEYSAAFKLYQKTFIKPIQDIILENVNRVLGLVNGVEITPFLITFDNEQ